MRSTLVSTVLMALAFATGGSADPAAAKGTSGPAHVTAVPAVTIITGSPLQIHVGDDSSFQVFNSDVPGSGQVYPTGATETADMGWFVRTADTLFAPNFSEHPAGTATSGLGAYTAFTPASLSGVSGAGTTASPFRVTVSGTLGGSGLSADLQVAYVNGDNYFTKVFTVRNDGSTAQSLKIFFGADIYLASSDEGVPFREPTSGSPGGQDCATTPTYTILLIPQNSPDAYTGRSYNTVWSEIGGGQLDNGVDADCEDNGAALQWNRTVAAGASTSIQASTSFGDIPAITQFNVTAVNPASGNPGGSVPVNISGIGFLSTTTFDFGAAITVSDLQIVDSNSATATLTIDAAAVPGPRDVVATQGQPELAGGTGGVTATLVDGFTVLGGGGGGPSTPVGAPTLNVVGLLALLLAMVASAGAAWRRR